MLSMDELRSLISSLDRRVMIKAHGGSIDRPLEPLGTSYYHTVHTTYNRLCCMHIAVQCCCKVVFVFLYLSRFTENSPFK